MTVDIVSCQSWSISNKERYRAGIDSDSPTTALTKQTQATAISDSRRLRRACTSTKYRHNICCFYMYALSMEIDEVCKEFCLFVLTELTFFQ